MSDPYYIAAWVVYLASAVALFLIVWYLSRRLRPALLRKLLRVTVLALLFTPAAVGDGDHAIAPAYLVAVFAAAGEGIDAARPALVPLLAALGLLNAVVVAGYFGGWSKTADRKGDRQED